MATHRAGVYERLGVRTVVNARGCATNMGGSLMPQEVVDAMAEASRHFVDVVELSWRVGEIIARVTGAEAGYVTAGASAGILLATAALMTGKDPAKIGRLPDTTGMKNEVVIQRTQRHSYDPPILTAGARLVEIGHAFRTHPWALEAAINERTAGVFYSESYYLPPGSLRLPEVVRIAHARGVPVYVDAAAMLPPAYNLQRYVAEGADLVIFSGGKGLMGPQSTGMLCGRKDLVEAAALNASPNHAIGRPAKVSKEEIAGLAVALELYAQRDHAADHARWRRQAAHVVDAVAAIGLPGVRTAVVYYEDDEDQIPQAHVAIQEQAAGITAKQVEAALYNGEPRIATFYSVSPRTVIVNPHMLRDGEEEIVARRIADILTAAARSVGVGGRQRG